MLGCILPHVTSQALEIRPLHYWHLACTTGDCSFGYLISWQQGAWLGWVPVRKLSSCSHSEGRRVVASLRSLRAGWKGEGHGMLEGLPLHRIRVEKWQCLRAQGCAAGVSINAWCVQVSELGWRCIPSSNVKRGLSVQSELWGKPSLMKQWLGASFDLWCCDVFNKFIRHFGHGWRFFFLHGVYQCISVSKQTGVRKPWTDKRVSQSLAEEVNEIIDQNLGCNNMNSPGLLCLSMKSFPNAFWEHCYFLLCIYYTSVYLYPFYLPRWTKLTSAMHFASNRL